MTFDNQHILKTGLSSEAIMRALFENYESIYDIDAETSAYQCYHESNLYSELGIKSSGEDFFAVLSSNIPKIIYPEDQPYVRKMLFRETMLRVLKKDRYYSFVYRLMLGGKPVYHKVRATLETVNGRRHILLGVRNVDETIRQEKAHTEAIVSMYQKEKNHMEAILASAEGYIEVNLTRDRVLEMSPNPVSASGSPVIEVPFLGYPLLYSVLNRWIMENRIVENRERYEKVSDREFLITGFTQGEKRASVYFSSRRKDGGVQPCREVFYLYQDNPSGDIMALCVIYDLTEQQRKEKELQELESKLQMSRIRNSTSQMQPHFLYNALGSIQEIVLTDPEYASRLIGDFTTHMRSCVRAMSSDALIPFEQELSNIKAYVNIEKMRFGDKLNVVYDVEASDFMILPLSIQPLVENAIRHGIYERGAKGGTVTVRSREYEDRWVVEVEDDGVGFDVAAFQEMIETGKKDSTGLKNLIFRLDTVMKADVEVQSTVGSGTRVTVSIPKGEVCE